jgi:hypothetical protein
MRGFDVILEAMAIDTVVAPSRRVREIIDDGIPDTC